MKICPQASFQRKVKWEDVKGMKKILFSLSPHANVRMRNVGLEEDEVRVCKCTELQPWEV